MDPNTLVRKWLATGLPSPRVSVAVLPAYEDKNNTGFNPADGAWAVVSVVGGGFHSEAPIFNGQIQITVYANVDEVIAAVNMTSAIRALIHGQNHIDLSPDGFVMACNENLGSQPGAEPDAGYATMISMYDMILRSN